jgi:uncharacterized membrane protein
MLKDKLIHALEEQRSLDRLADPLQHTVAAVLARAPRLAGVLHGKWLGHPLHAALVTIPIGGWTIGLALDLASVVGGRRRFRPAADMATAIGLGGALMASLAGLADWSLTHGKARRVGLAHALLNTTVASLYGASLVARAGGVRSVGIGLSTAGFGLVGISGWLGGELAYRYGVGVRKVALDASEGGEAGRAAPDAEGEPLSKERIAETPH